MVFRRAEPVQQPQQPHKGDALAFLASVKSRFEHRPDVHSRFMHIMKQFQHRQLDTKGVIMRAKHLFHGHVDLLHGLVVFLPPVRALGVTA
jgi:histone deacetylase complex regulatory component SIN3